jgi:hypothetical protein
MSSSLTKGISGLVELFNSSKDETGSIYEFELGVGFETGKNEVNKFLYEKLFNFYKSKSNNSEIIQNLDVYYSNGIRKTIIFVKGVNQKKDIFIKKQNIGSSFINRSIKNVKNIKLKLSKENEIKEGEDSVRGSDISFMRFKLRVRFYINDKYYVELDLIRTVESNELSRVSAKSIKDSVFKEYEIANILNGLEYSLFNEMRLEFEFQNKTKGSLVLENIFSPINELSGIFNIDIDLYQKYIFTTARNIIQNKHYLENFRFKSGLKKLLNNVIEMDAEVYYKKIQPKIDNGFYITDKIDGKRCICILKEYKDSNGIVGEKWEIALLSNELKVFSNGRPKGKVEYILTIIDCEMLIKDDTIYLYSFDVITFKNEKIAMKPFSFRFELLKQSTEQVNKYTESVENAKIILMSKDFILMNENWKDQIKDFYNRKRNYEIDGLIFTPNDESNYGSMVGYKWKPAEHSTIDFYMKKVEADVLKFEPFNQKKLKNNETMYVLFSGISKRDYDKFNMSLIPSYQNIFKNEKNNDNLWKNPLIPIQFSTSDNPHNYIYIHKNEENIDNKIGEFGWNQLDNCWTLRKIRVDRDVELARGEYYGNYFKVAESIWFSIQNPLTFDKLFVDNTGYFAEDNNEFYKSQRNYNSFVKTKILEAVLPAIQSDNLFVIDLAAGKGQDMARLSNLKVKHTLFVDNDKNALSELMKRKHNLKSNYNMKISVANIDLSLDYKNNVKHMNKSIEGKIEESADLVIMNFAIHYFTGSLENIINLVNLAKCILKKGGRFVFTCFDGDKVYDLCKESGWNAVENDILKYSIKQIQVSQTEGLVLGQKVKLILPFSKGEYYEEFLVNLKTINKIFQDNGFSLEAQNSFQYFNNKYDKINNLSEDDKRFVNLYSYSVFRKNNSDTITWRPDVNIVNELGLYSDNVEISGSGETYIDKLINIPDSNRILLLCKDINLSNVQIKHIKNVMESYNYKDLSDNSKLKKKVFIIIKDEALYKKYIKSSKNISSVSVVVMEKNFIDNFEDKIQIILKTPIMDILINKECAILSIDSYLKKIEWETLEGTWELLNELYEGDKDKIIHII